MNLLAHSTILFIITTQLKVSSSKHSEFLLNTKQSENSYKESIDSELNAIKSRLEKLEKGAYATYPKSCQDVKDRGYYKSRIYIIKPKIAPKPFAVFCDMETEGGGWTHFFNRNSEAQSFYLTWKFYKSGFGNINGTHWLGLDYLHYITESEINEIYIKLTDWDDVTAYAYYDQFIVGDETGEYLLKSVGKYKGTAGDCISSYAGRQFTTKDRDNDLRKGSNCAVDEHGAWWYDSCSNTNPMSKYLSLPNHTSSGYSHMYWRTFRGVNYSLKKMTMMVRPRRVEK